MTFSELVRQTELYLGMEGQEPAYMIKQFINESIIEFCNMHEWQKLKMSDVIILTNANSYDLSVLLTEKFIRELRVVTPYGGNIYYGNELKKYTGDYVCLYEGIVYGLGKSIAYGSLSWIFPLYVYSKHNTRKDDLCHYKMYMIPNSNKIYKYMLYRNFFLKEGIVQKIYHWR